MTWQDGMDALSNAKLVNVLYNLESGPMRISIDWSAVFEMKNQTIFIYTNTSYKKVYQMHLQIN